MSAPGLELLLDAIAPGPVSGLGPAVDSGRFLATLTGALGDPAAARPPELARLLERLEPEAPRTAPTPEPAHPALAQLVASLVGAEGRAQRLAEAAPATPAPGNRTAAAPQALPVDVLRALAPSRQGGSPEATRGLAVVPRPAGLDVGVPETPAASAAARSGVSGPMLPGASPPTLGASPSTLPSASAPMLPNASAPTLPSASAPPHPGALAPAGSDASAPAPDVSAGVDRRPSVPTDRVQASLSVRDPALATERPSTPVPPSPTTSSADPTPRAAEQPQLAFERTLTPAEDPYRRGEATRAPSESEPIRRPSDDLQPRPNDDSARRVVDEPARRGLEPERRPFDDGGRRFAEDDSHRPAEDERRRFGREPGARFQIDGLRGSPRSTAGPTFDPTAVRVATAAESAAPSAAEAPAESARSSAVPASRVPEALAAHVERLSQGGGGTARIRLHPQNLGELHLHVRVRGQSVEVTVVAQEVAAKALVEGGREQLSEALASRELRMDGFEVHSGPRDTADGSSREMRADLERQGRESGQNRRDEAAGQPRRQPSAEAGLSTNASARPSEDDPSSETRRVHWVI